MSDLTGPMDGCFKVIAIFAVILFGTLCIFSYYSDEDKLEKERQEKKEIYLKGVSDASNIVKCKLDSILKNKKN